MGRRILLAAVVGCLMCGSALAQAAAVAPELRSENRTLYTRHTELSAEWRPPVIGQAMRLNAHLTRISERFGPIPKPK